MLKSKEVQVTFVGAERLVKGMLHWSTKVIRYEKYKNVC